MLLKDLQDRHSGSMGFVIGGGPSLHFQDLSPLNDYVTVAVNSGIVKHPKCDYFLSDDIGVKHWSYFHDEVKNNNCIKLLYEEKLKNEISHLNKEEVILYKHTWWYSPEDKKYNFKGLDMTKNVDLPIVGARTSAASAVHFLYIMGCCPIVLLGCDCCYYERKRYFWQFPGEKRTYRINGRPPFSVPNKGKKRGKPVDSHCCDFDDYWNHFQRINKDKVDIIYASEGGILDCFPKMTLKEVLLKYENRKKIINDKQQ